MIIIVIIFVLILYKFNLVFKVLNYFKEKDVAFYLNLLNIDRQEFHRIRSKNIQLLTLTLLFWPLLNYSIVFLFFLILMLTLSYKLPYLNLKKKYQNNLKALVYYFPIWLRQLQILMQNNTVYQALSISLNQAPVLFQPEIKILINKLSDNPLSYQAYEDFFGFYQVREIKKVMRLLYRYQTVGQKEAYLQLQRIILTTSNILSDKREAYYEEWLSWHQWYGLLPLVGATAVFLLLMMNVLMNFFTKGALL